MEKKNIILVLFFLMIGITCYAQVGINTEDPQATLDINGNLRIRTVEKCSGLPCIDSILVKTNGGYIQSISKAQLAISNNVSFVSGTGSGSTILANVIIISDWRRIQFDKEIIDENNDFDVITNTFTAPKDGIYKVYVQSKTSSLISAGDFGVGIFVQRGMNAPELVAEENYVNVSVLGISVSPPTRSTQILLALNFGDKIIFGVKSILSVDILSETSSFFTINQVK